VVLTAAVVRYGRISREFQLEHARVGVSLILKKLTNPYFVSTENDAKQEATKDGVNLTVSADTPDGGTQTHISAIDNPISRGDKGIIIIIPNGKWQTPNWQFAASRYRAWAQARARR
jgi:ABC-type sugar transport system substrate-binding protein